MSKQNKKQSRLPFISVLIIIGIFISLISTHFSSDSYILANADPEMSALADRAYMTNQAKIIFLKTNPERVDNSRIETECSHGTDTSSITLEAGCYDPNTNKIFLRDLPERFDNFEPVVAAHEMLHAAYYVSKPNESVLQELKTSQSSIQNKLKLYEGNDEQSLINETHSFIGSEIKPNNLALSSYYSQYFYDQLSLAQLSENHTIELNNMLTELNNTLATAETWNTAAQQYYSNHSVAASYGDAYNANRYYNLYIEHLNTYNKQIANYNTRVAEYNSLIEALNGKPLDQVPVSAS